MDLLRCLKFIFFEKLLHWCLHPKVRSRVLQYCGARIGTSVRVDNVLFLNNSCGFKNITFDDGVYIGPNCFFDLTGKIEIGARTAVSPGCSFLTHSDPGSNSGNSLAKIFPRKVERITIGSDCWIGAGAIILCGVSIGNGSVVAAGAVVTRDVSAGILVAGNPARVVKPIEISAVKQ